MNSFYSQFTFFVVKQGPGALLRLPVFYTWNFEPRTSFARSFAESRKPYILAHIVCCIMGPRPCIIRCSESEPCPSWARCTIGQSW